MTLTPGDPSAETSFKGHSSLGLLWDFEADILNIKMKYKDRRFTKRGPLGYIMSPCDPFGIAQPAMLMPKLLQRETIPPEQDDSHNYHHLGWDDPLSNQFKA